MASKKVNLNYSLASKIGLKFVLDNPLFNDAYSRYDRLKTFIEELRERLISYSVQQWRVSDEAGQLGNCLLDMFFLEDDGFKPAVAFRYSQEDGIYGYTNHLQEAFMRGVVSPADRWHAEINDLEVWVKHFKKAYFAHSHYTKKVTELQAKLEVEAQKSKEAQSTKERLERNQKKLIEVQQEYHEISQQTCHHLNTAWDLRVRRLNLILGRLILFQESRAVHQLMLAFGTSKILRGTTELEDEEFYGSLGVEPFLPKAETKHMEGVLVRKGKVINSKGFYRLRGRTLQAYDYISEPTTNKRQALLSEPKEEYEVTASSMPAELTIRVQCESGSDIVLFGANQLEADRWHEAFQAAAGWDRTVSHRKVEAKLKRTLEFRETVRALDMRSLEGLEREFGVVDTIRYSQSIPSMVPALNGGTRAASSTLALHSLGQSSPALFQTIPCNTNIGSNNSNSHTSSSSMTSPPQPQGQSQRQRHPESFSHITSSSNSSERSSVSSNVRRSLGAYGHPPVSPRQGVIVALAGPKAGELGPSSPTHRGASPTRRAASSSMLLEQGRRDQPTGGERQDQYKRHDVPDTRQERPQRMELPQNDGEGDDGDGQKPHELPAGTPTKFGRLAPPLPRPPLSKSAAPRDPPPSPSAELSPPLSRQTEQLQPQEHDNNTTDGEEDLQDEQSPPQCELQGQLQLYEKRLREQQQEEMEQEQEARRESGWHLSIDSAEPLQTSPGHQRAKTDAGGTLASRSGSTFSLKRTGSLHVGANAASKVWQRTKVKLGLSKKDFTGTNTAGRPTSPSWQHTLSACQRPSVTSQDSGGGLGSASPSYPGDAERLWSFEGGEAGEGRWDGGGGGGGGADGGGKGLCGISAAQNLEAIMMSGSPEKREADSDDDDDVVVDVDDDDAIVLLPSQSDNKGRERSVDGAKTVTSQTGGMANQARGGVRANELVNVNGRGDKSNDSHSGTKDAEYSADGDELQLEVFRQLCGTVTTPGEPVSLLSLGFDRLMRWEELQELQKEGVLSIEETKLFMVRAGSQGGGARRGSAGSSAGDGVVAGYGREEKQEQKEAEESMLNFRSFCCFISFLEDKQFEQDLLHRWGVRLKDGPSMDV